MIGALTIGALVSGCGDEGSAEGNAAGATVTVTSTPESSPTTETPSATESAPDIVVSARTTCDQLFANNGRGPLDVVIDWWSTPDGMTPKVSDALEEVEQVASTAGPDLEPYLLTIVSETRGAIANGGDTTVFKAAGYEVANVCSG